MWQQLKDIFERESGGDYLRSRLEAQLQAAEAVIRLREEIPDSVHVDDLKKWWAFAVAIEDLVRHVENARNLLGSQSWFACNGRAGDNAVLDSVENLERWQDRWNPMIKALQAQVDISEGGCAGEDEKEIAQRMKKLSMPEILALMRDNPSNEKLQANGCLRLGSCSREKGEFEQVATDGGIEQALAAMRSYPSSLRVQKHGTMFLAAFSADASLDSKLVSLGAIKVVVDAMRKFLRSQSVQEHCMQALVNISRKSNESKIASLGGIEVLVSSMKAHPTSEKLQRCGCAALGNLATSSKAAKDIFSQGGIELAVSAMKTHPKSGKVQSKGCYAISHFAATSEARKLADRRHATESVLEAMEQHTEDAKVQEHGCVALIALAQSNSLKAKIISLGGIRLVRCAFQSHIRVKEMQQLGPRTLKALEV